MSRRAAIAIVVATLLADQLSKILVRARVDEFETLVIVPGCLNIIRSTNTGIAFGMFSDYSPTATRVALIIIGVAVMGIIGWLLWRSAASPADWKASAALALMLGGAGGNLLDRIWHGEVTDFIDFYVGSYHWYTFNVADAAITIAAALLLLDILMPRDASKSTE